METLADLSVVAAAITDDRSRRFDLELVSMVGCTATMISVEVRRVSTAKATCKKHQFWNEAGRFSDLFEPPELVARYRRFRLLQGLKQ